MGAFSERPTNRILDVLSAGDFHLLQPHLELVTLKAGQVLERPNSEISHAYFITSGVVSIRSAASANRCIEVGMIGCEGLTGIAIALGSGRSSNEALVPTGGTALRLPGAGLREAMTASPALSEILLRYVHVFLVQMSHTALANGCGTIKQRLARWLLMWQDRRQTASFEFTHDLPAMLLGVRRPGVTDALHELEGLKLVETARTRLRIVDRTGLERIAGGYYGGPEAEYERAFYPKTSHQPVENVYDEVAHFPDAEDTAGG